MALSAMSGRPTLPIEAKVVPSRTVNEAPTLDKPPGPTSMPLPQEVDLGLVGSDEDVRRFVVAGAPSEYQSVGVLT